MGYISAENRKSQAQFVCGRCGFSAPADFVSAVNIREAGLASLACSLSSGEVRPSSGRNPPKVSPLWRGTSRNSLPLGREGCQLPESVRRRAVGNWLVVEDNHNRVLLCSISTGEQLVRWFGYRPETSRNGQRLCLANGRGHLLVYDLGSLKQIDDLYFANSVTAHNFSADGKKLFVLTNDQTAFEFGVPSDAIKAASQ